MLKKLSTISYSAITNDEWDDLPGTTNPVESTSTVVECRSEDIIAFGLE